MGEIHSFLGKLAGGLNASPSLLVDTFIMHCMVMEEKDAWLLTKTKFWLTGSILRHQTAYQFYGCKWHSCPCLETANDRAERRYRQTMAIENQIRGLGYSVVSVWECFHPELSIKLNNSIENSFLIHTTSFMTLKWY